MGRRPPHRRLVDTSPTIPHTCGSTKYTCHHVATEFSSSKFHQQPSRLHLQQHRRTGPRRSRYVKKLLNCKTPHNINKKRTKPCYTTQEKSSTNTFDREDTILKKGVMSRLALQPVPSRLLFLHLPIRRPLIHISLLIGAQTLPADLYFPRP